ncbi:MAG TPA: M15 family metallopeptidase [Acidimicrobiales bacterium]
MAVPGPVGAAPPLPARSGADNPQAKRSYHVQHGHPYPGGLVLVSTMPQNAAAIGGRYGFRWGGTYGGTTKPDPMHFEFMGTPGDAARLAVITRSGGFNDVGTLEGNQKSQLSNADQRTKAILEILRDGGPDATVGRRTKEMTIILRSLTGFATEEELEDAFSKGTDTRALLKSLVEGAVLDGLREPDDAHPGRGTLRVPLKKILHEVLDERANA